MGKQLEIPEEQDNATLVPLTAELHDAVGERLKTVYEGVPGETVKLCERHRVGMARDNLEHLRQIRDALAPFGKFKEWCQAVGVNYTTVTMSLTEAVHPRKHTKREVMPSITAPSLPAPANTTEPAERADLVDERTNPKATATETTADSKPEPHEALPSLPVWESPVPVPTHRGGPIIGDSYGTKDCLGAALVHIELRERMREFVAFAKLPYVQWALKKSNIEESTVYRDHHHGVPSVVRDMERLVADGDDEVVGERFFEHALHRREEALAAEGEVTS
jgi:hypothetical protein